MIQFADEVHRKVYYPDDRRHRLWIKPGFIYGLVAIVVALVVAAWIQRLAFGMPHIAINAALDQGKISGPHGFPGWIRWTHFFNFLFLTMLIRSGLSILADHPRLYFNDDCTPNTEWIRFTPLRVPVGKRWTAKDDARYISPLLGLPGYKHTIGMARSWHFLNVYGFILTGIVFVIGLLTTDQWLRLVPTSPAIFAEAWATFVHYATFTLPPEPNGFYGYNALQQLAYFATVFIMAPISIMTGMCMSPALVNRAPWFAKLFGGRQSARSIHFLMMVGFACFLVVHVTLIVLTGFVRNMNHIVLGKDEPTTLGMWLGLTGIAVVVLVWVAAHQVAWRHPRRVQHLNKAISLPLWLATLNRLDPVQTYTREQVSPHMWPNGMLPVREDWLALKAGGFRDFRLKVGGLVENPLELSLEQMEEIGRSETVTMHHCIQGWSGIAGWGGIPLSKIVELARPLPSAKTIAFYSFGPALFGGGYYDTQAIASILKPGAMLAYEMNGARLADEYGAPLRLRVDDQLGYKMVKWIERIEFVESEKVVGKGEGGKNEDDEYFDLLPNL
ncbi:MAG: molybdopterin-dependent oxidoreductase [Acidobacteria bacterium]|nr:molybdopterin-dependent oxidoreductase [Acidobacteriota bacterium]